MNAWYVLMCIVCRAEFPEHDNLHAYSIFNLYMERQARRSSLHNQDSADCRESASRVARLANVGPERLLHELGTRKPIAANICERNQCTNKEAWR